MRLPPASMLRDACIPRWSRKIVTTTFAAVAALTRSSNAFVTPKGRHIQANYCPCRNPPLSFADRRARCFSAVSSSQQTNEERKMTKDAVKIVKSAIDSVSPYTAVKNHFQLADNCRLSIGGSGSETTQVDLKEYDEVTVVAFGKASSAMATAVVQQLQSADLSSISGLVICKDDHATEEQEYLERYNVRIRYASHPVPDQRSSNAASEMIDLVSSDTDASKRLFICCISGGGSALFCSPHERLTLQDLQDTNSALLSSGMGIDKMNVVRKRLERGKGGRLARACHEHTNESRLITLILSDVLGDPLDLIASGPTVPDTSSWIDAWNIIESYQGLQDKLPQAVVELLKEGLDGKQPDSPSPEDKCFDSSRSTNILVGNNQVAVEAAANKAKDLGYQPVILGNHVEGEAKDVAHVYTAMAQYLQQTLSSQSNAATNQFTIASSLPVALIVGGETTVTIPPEHSDGKGGRNQELALSAAVQFESLRLRNVVLASVGTDGTDGPTDAAGAVVDGATVATSRTEALDALRRHNAYPYLDGGALLKTGPTGTNVADVCVTLVGRAPEE